MKKALPRFVTGILIVPFTWFIVSGILSISNLLTASVLRLPADILTASISSVSGNETEPTFSMPEKCTLSFDRFRGNTGSTAPDTSNQAKPSETAGKFFECSKQEKTSTFKDVL